MSGVGTAASWSADAVADELTRYQRVPYKFSCSSTPGETLEPAFEAESLSSCWPLPVSACACHVPERLGAAQFYLPHHLHRVCHLEHIAGLLADTRAAGVVAVRAFVGRVNHDAAAALMTAADGKVDDVVAAYVLASRFAAAGTSLKLTVGSCFEMLSSWDEHATDMPVLQAMLLIAWEEPSGDCLSAPLPMDGAAILLVMQRIIRCFPEYVPYVARRHLLSPMGASEMPEWSLDAHDYTNRFVKGLPFALMAVTSRALKKFLLASINSFHAVGAWGVGEGSGTDCDTFSTALLFQAFAALLESAPPYRPPVDVMNGISTQAWKAFFFHLSQLPCSAAGDYARLTEIIRSFLPHVSMHTRAVVLHSTPVNSVLSWLIVLVIMYGSATSGPFICYCGGDTGLCPFELISLREFEELHAYLSALQAVMSGIPHGALYLTKCHKKFASLLLKRFGMQVSTDATTGKGHILLDCAVLVEALKINAPMQQPSEDDWLYDTLVLLDIKELTERGSMSPPCRLNAALSKFELIATIAGLWKHTAGSVSSLQVSLSFDNHLLQFASEDGYVASQHISAAIPPEILSAAAVTLTVVVNACAARALHEGAVASRDLAAYASACLWHTITILEAMNDAHPTRLCLTQELHFLDAFRFQGSAQAVVSLHTTGEQLAESSGVPVLTRVQDVVCALVSWVYLSNNVAKVAAFAVSDLIATLEQALRLAHRCISACGCESSVTSMDSIDEFEWLDDMTATWMCRTRLCHNLVAAVCAAISRRAVDASLLSPVLPVLLKVCRTPSSREAAYCLSALAAGGTKLSDGNHAREIASLAFHMQVHKHPPTISCSLRNRLSLCSNSAALQTGMLATVEKCSHGHASLEALTILPCETSLAVVFSLLCSVSRFVTQLDDDELLPAPSNSNHECVGLGRIPHDLLEKSLTTASALELCALLISFLTAHYLDDWMKGALSDSSWVGSCPSFKLLFNSSEPKHEVLACRIATLLLQCAFSLIWSLVQLNQAGAGIIAHDMIDALLTAWRGGALQCDTPQFYAQKISEVALLRFLEEFLEYCPEVGVGCDMEDLIEARSAAALLLQAQDAPARKKSPKAIRAGTRVLSSGALAAADGTVLFNRVGSLVPTSRPWLWWCCLFELEEHASDGSELCSSSSEELARAPPTSRSIAAARPGEPTLSHQPVSVAAAVWDEVSLPTMDAPVAAQVALPEARLMSSMPDRQLTPTVASAITTSDISADHTLDAYQAAMMWQMMYQGMVAGASMAQAQHTVASTARHRSRHSTRRKRRRERSAEPASSSSSEEWGGSGAK